MHEGHHCKPFRSIQELKEKTIEVWDEGATDLHTIRKGLEQFLPHLCAVCEQVGGLIKSLLAEYINNIVLL